MAGPDDFTSRLQTAGQAVGPQNPQLATTLAQSDLNHSEIAQVGGFAKALQLATSKRLADDSGAKTNFTTQQLSNLSNINEPVPQKDNTDSRSWLEKAMQDFGSFWSNTGNFLVHNPVTHAIETAGNFLGNVAHYPFRLLSSGLDTGNNAEINREMSADGYDPSSTTSYLSFMFNQGNNVYHDLGHARATYGDDLVDAVVLAQRDPAKFQQELENSDPAQAASLKAMTDSPEWAQAYAAVDQRSISPGRDLARVLTLGHTNNGAFTAISGALDAAYDWFSDPTLIMGKGAALARGMDVLSGDLQNVGRLSRFGPSALAARGIDIARGGNQRAGLAGVDGIIDQSAIDQLMRVDADGNAVTDVGKGWQRFLLDAKSLRDASAAAKTATTAEEKAKALAEQSGIYRAIVNRYAQTGMLPLMDEVNGARVIGEADHTAGVVDNITTGGTDGGNITMRMGEQPIEDLGELSKYLASKNGLIRMDNGVAAKREIVMPGRLSWGAERKAAADTRTATKTAKKSLWLDYTKGGIQPDASEAQLLDTTAASVGDQQHQLLQRNALISSKARAAKADRLSRRITTLIPNVKQIDLRNGGSSRIVEQFARIYMNKGDAARLASSYALSDMAGRRQIVKAMIEQTFHASGLSKSPDGLAFMEKYRGEIDGERQMYGHDGTDLINDNGTERAVAMYPDQLSPYVSIPNMKDLHFTANKFAVGAFARRTGLASVQHFAESDFADKMMATIKLGWITSVAGGLRNALDEWGNFAVNHLGREAIAARSAYTQATSAGRQERIAASHQFRSLMQANGASEATIRDQMRLKFGQALVDHDTAKAQLETAQRGDLALLSAPGTWDARTQEMLDKQAKLTDNLRQLAVQRDAVRKSMPANPLVAEPSLRDSYETLQQQTEDARHALHRHESAIEERQRLSTVKDSEHYKPTPDEARALVQAKLDKAGVLSLPDAQAQLKTTEARLRQAKALESAIAYRVPLFARQTADNINDLLSGVVLGKLSSVFGKRFRVTPEMVGYARELTEGELTQVLREGVMQPHYNDSGLFLASDDYAMALHDAGLRARSYGYSGKSLGWGQVETDGGAGLDAMAKTLQLRFTDPSSPAHAWVQTVHRMGGTLDQTALDSAKAAVRDRLDEEDLRHFVTDAEMLQQTRAGTKVAGNEVLLGQAKDEYAERVSADLLKALAHQGETGPEIHPDLLGMLADSQETGLVPDRSWLANNVPTDQRPPTAIGRLWAPYNGTYAPDEMPRGYTQMMTKAYGKVVGDQIAALSRNPLVTALYVNARRNTLPYRAKLVDAGWSEDTADEVVKRLALQHAQNEALKHIDNPYVASQFSLLNRNWFSFVRAQEDWGRRWGRTLRDNPQLIREAQLLIHGGESVGFLEQDDQNNLRFVYPGSALALKVFGKAFGALGMGNATQIPMAGELTSQLMFVNPSLDNPIGLTGTPLLSIPAKALTSLMGSDAPIVGHNPILGASIDEIVNGNLGAGRKWYETVLPQWANRIMSGVLGSADDGQSKYMAAMTQSIMQMEAAGQLDDPALQTPSGKARFQQALSAQVRNNLALTALLGTFAPLPAAPSLDPQATGAGHADPGTPGTGNRADWSAHQVGLMSLTDEARKVISDLGYEKGLAWWQKVHPGELIYVQGGARTEVNTSKATAPATIRAATWLEQNPGFVSQYGGKGGIAAYFLPNGAPGTTDGSYSNLAYRAELEAGIRTYKTLDNYFDDVVTARGEQQYYLAKGDYDQQRLAAVSSGSPTAVKNVDDQWATKKAELYKANPLLPQKFAAYAADNAAQGIAIQQVAKLASDTTAATKKALGANRAGVQGLYQAWVQYQAATAKVGDSRSKLAVKARQQVKDQYLANVTALAGGPNSQYPELADLARGVFQLPN